MCLIHTFFRNSPLSGKTATAAPSKKRKPRQLAMADSDSDSEEEEHMLPLEVDSTAHVHSNNVDDDEDSDGDSRLVICEPSSSSQEAGIGTRDSELEKDSLHYSPVTGSPINTVDLSFEANAQTEVHVHAPGSQSSCEDSDLEEADVIPPVVRVGNSGVGHGAAGNGSVGADTNTGGTGNARDSARRTRSTRWRLRSWSAFKWRNCVHFASRREKGERCDLEEKVQATFGAGK